MMALRMEFDRREHPVGRAVREVEKRNIERLTTLIEAGRREGSIPPGPPLAPALLGAIEGLAMVVAGRPHDEELAERVARGVLGLARS